MTLIPTKIHHGTGFQRVSSSDLQIEYILTLDLTSWDSNYVCQRFFITKSIATFFVKKEEYSNATIK
jgi:hypothetical protein